MQNKNHKPEKFLIDKKKVIFYRYLWKHSFQRKRKFSDIYNDQITIISLFKILEKRTKPKINNLLVVGSFTA